MKLRNKDTKKYLLSVAVCTFVAYVIPYIFYMEVLTMALAGLFAFAC